MLQTPSDQPRSGSLLHVGCGGDPAPAWASDYAETRLDIDPRHSPDICASMTDMGDIGPFDLVFSSHSLEHLAPHDVHKALTEFLRVLKPDGRAVIVVPDLEDIKPTEDVVYESPAGPVTGLDMFYGMARLLEDMPFMAHRCGFVRETLKAAILRAGFRDARVDKLAMFNLVALGVK